VAYFVRQQKYAKPFTFTFQNHSRSALDIVRLLCKLYSSFTCISKSFRMQALLEFQILADLVYIVLRISDSLQKILDCTTDNSWFVCRTAISLVAKLVNHFCGDSSQVVQEGTCILLSILYSRDIFDRTVAVCRIFLMGGLANFIYIFF